MPVASLARMLAAALLLFAAPSLADNTELMSISMTGTCGDANDSTEAVSADGRYVVFDSMASNLVPGDTNGTWDVFERDRLTGQTQCVSVSPGGAVGNGFSRITSVSADGRFVAFVSGATNLIAGDTNGRYDVFVRDLQLQTTECVSVASDGSQANLDSGTDKIAISADGRFVAFESGATNLVPGNTNNRSDVYVHDRETGLTERVNVQTGGGLPLYGSEKPSISGDGRYVAFESADATLAGGEMHGWLIYVRDRTNGTTVRASVNAAGESADSDCVHCTISANGRYLAFCSNATNLVDGGTNGQVHVFVRDLQTGTVELVNVASGGARSNGDTASLSPTSISPDGRYVAFVSRAGDLAPGANGTADVYIRDRGANVTERVSVASDGAIADDWCDMPSVTADGGSVVFRSYSTNLAAGTLHSVISTYAHDRGVGLLMHASAASYRIGATAPIAATLTSQPGGLAVTGETIQFYVDGVSAGSTTSAAGGKATVQFPVTESLGEGPHIVTALHAPSASYGRIVSTAVLTAVKGIPALSLYAASGNVGDTVNLKTLFMCGVPIIGRTVQFSVDGVPVGSAVSTSSGASLAWKIPASLALGSHSVTASFDGDGTYAPATRTTVALTVRSNVLFSLFATTGIPGQKVTLHTLVYSGGAPLTGKTVKFSVDGSLVGSAVSDAAGAALDWTISATMAAGPHNVTVAFAGDTAYNAATRTTAALTVGAPKSNVAFSLYAVSGSAGQTVTLKSLMLSGGKALVGKTVQFSVDGGVVGTGVSDANGVACSYAIPLAMTTGPHTVTVTFAGDAGYNAATRTTAALTVK